MDIASISLNIYIAIIPSVLLCLYVYHMDSIEKEPLKMLLLLFFVGVLITLPASFMEQVMISALFGVKGSNIAVSGYTDIFILSFFIISIIEEGYKFLILLISSWKNKEFDYKYDAIVYSVFISLGFATFENIRYIESAGISIALWRGIISVPAHAFYAIASGYFLGVAKESKKNNKTQKKFLYLILSLLIPIILHGIFDFLLLTESNVLFGIFISFIALLYIVSFMTIKNTHRDKKIIE